MDDVAKAPVPLVHIEVSLSLPDGQERSFSYDFRQPVITLGRDPSNDIQVPLTTVSRQHARIFFEIGDFFLEDLGSTHGTEHNQKRLAKGEKRLLRDGDRLRVMSFELLFKTTSGGKLDLQPGEKPELLARRMAEEVLASLGGGAVEQPALRIMNGPGEGERYELGAAAAELTLGRNPDCDIRLADENASRRHCLVKRSWHGFTAQDLGSKNGVLVNGSRIEGAQLLKDGDTLQIGGVKLSFIDPPSRLMAQMGAPDATEQAVEEAAPAEAEEDPYQDDGFEAEPVPAASEPFAAPLPAPSEPEPPELPEGMELSDVEKLHADTQRGGGWELALLIVGVLLLLGAVGFLVFLLI